ALQRLRRRRARGREAARDRRPGWHLRHRRDFRRQLALHPDRRPAAHRLAGRRRAARRPRLHPLRAATAARRRPPPRRLAARPRSVPPGDQRPGHLRGRRRPPRLGQTRRLRRRRRRDRRLLHPRIFERDLTATETLSELDHELVDVAPAPLLTRLDGTHERVLAGVEVLGRMSVLRRIAAADMSTHHAQAEMEPGVACFQTLLTPLCPWLDVADLIQVSTARPHWGSPLSVFGSGGRVAPGPLDASFILLYPSIRIIG